MFLESLTEVRLRVRVGLFPLVFCFLRENCVRSWAFPSVCSFSVRAQKLNQHPAVCDVWYEEQRCHNQEKQGAAVDIFFLVLLFLRRLNVYNKHKLKALLQYGALSHVFPHIIRHKLQKWLLIPPFWAAMLMAQNRKKKKKILGGKTMDMPEKEWKTIIMHGLKCK